MNQYIITEDDLEQLAKNVSVKAEKIAFKVLQHPYNPQELFREEIAKWKDEDPLFMSYVYGQRAGRKDGWEKVLGELEAWRVQKVSNIRNPCSLENTNSAFGELEGKIKELRKDGE